MSDTPSQRRALEVLPPGGTVLDVGCGSGAAGLALAPPADRVVGVDESPDMLAAFATAAGERSIAYDVVAGRWPDAAADVASADVVVCHHVSYNVPDLVPFAHALSAHARNRVVLEMTARHPLVALAPLWRHFHGLDRPAGPTSDLCRDVLAEAGCDVQMERCTAPARPVPFEARVAFTRKRLCLPVEREPEVAALLRAEAPAPPRELVTLWWS